MERREEFDVLHEYADRDKFFQHARAVLDAAATDQTCEGVFLVTLHDAGDGKGVYHQRITNFGRHLVALEIIHDELCASIQKLKDGEVQQSTPIN